MPSSGTKTASYGVAAAAVVAFVLAQWPLAAAQDAPGTTPVPAPTQQAAAPSTRPCHARGVVKSGTTPLPGASVTAKNGATVVAVTSTDVDGTYSVPLAPGTYTIHVDLTAFAAPDQSVTVGQPPCDVALDVPMTLGPRTRAARDRSGAGLRGANDNGRRARRAQTSPAQTAAAGARGQGCWSWRKNWRWRGWTTGRRGRARDVRHVRLPVAVGSTVGHRGRRGFVSRRHRIIFGRRSSGASPASRVFSRCVLGRRGGERQSGAG